MINIECFGCSGGMSEGFRRAGITFDFVFDYDINAVESYEANLGHRPIHMDVRDLLRMIEGGWGVGAVNLAVFDPPCTPWSRAGLRLGVDDERDMMVETVTIIRKLRPRCYLIGNVPGLEDSTKWSLLQEVLRPLAKDGYCIRDFATLDACDQGVPQHRWRPFWFGHLDGSCVRWPQPTHGDPKRLASGQLPGISALIPWVTCRQALGHLYGSELGRPVNLRKRSQNSKQHGSVEEKPARGVGTSNLSDGNVLLVDGKHPPSGFDEPATTVRGGGDGHSAPNMVLEIGGPPSTLSPRSDGMFYNSKADKPARALTGNTHGGGVILEPPYGSHPASRVDEPAQSVTTRHTSYNNLLVDERHPTTVDELVTTSKHPPSPLDGPAHAIRAGGGGGARDGSIVELGYRQSSSGPQSQRVYDADRPAPTVTTKDNREGNGAIVLTFNPRHHPESPDEPSKTIAAKVRMQSGEVLRWPWDTPSTTVCADERLPPPGHHPTEGSILSVPNAVLLSERAAAILQGFPDGECGAEIRRRHKHPRKRAVQFLGEGLRAIGGKPIPCDAVVHRALPGTTCPNCGRTRRWHFLGDVKKDRWSMLGQAMPPALAHAVADSIVEWAKQFTPPLVVDRRGVAP